MNIWFTVFARDDYPLEESPRPRPVFVRVDIAPTVRTWHKRLPCVLSSRFIAAGTLKTRVYPAPAHRLRNDLRFTGFEVLQRDISPILQFLFFAWKTNERLPAARMGSPLGGIPVLELVANLSVDHAHETFTVWFYVSGCSHAENETGYSSLRSSRNLSLPWRYHWHKKMLVMCISLTSGYLTWQTEAVCVL